MAFVTGLHQMKLKGGEFPRPFSFVGWRDHPRQEALFLFSSGALLPDDLVDSGLVELVLGPELQDIVAREVPVYLGVPARLLDVS